MSSEAGRHAKLVLATTFLLALFVSVSASYGDRSAIFQNCMHWCGVKNCSNSSRIADFRANRPWYLQFLRWECWDECDYFCMWHVVEIFQFNGLGIPIQEPASVVFSILNGLTHYYMWHKFRTAIRKCPFKFLWNVQALLSINAWFWSAIFHTRDTPLTEKLDYFCAFSMVLYSLYSLFIRVFSTDKPWINLTIAVPFLSYFAYHIYYLTYIQFDYGYNMRANIVIGILNSCGWIIWCYKYRHKRYVWKCAASVISVNLLLLLELCDFPPWNFAIDAHALWHLGTIPVPFLWYSFLTEDCLNEMESKSYLTLVKKLG